MAHQPILRPEDSEKPESSQSFPHDAVNHEITYPFLQLTNTFAANGAGLISADLALDLILNDIVEQACIATGGTGAAIALLRGDEMVCRASSGADVPGLGVRLDSRSGLSGACVQARALQVCADAETDPRVDAEACQHSGIRSIAVMPLLEGEELFGILEVFSPHANAFGELDIITLKALAQQVVENRKQADETTEKLETGTTGFPTVAARIENGGELVPSAVESADSLGNSSSDSQLPAMKAAGAHGDRKRSPVPIDFWTAFLAVLVIGAAVLMGTLAGWRFGLGRTTSVRPHGAARRNSVTEPKPVTATAAVTPDTSGEPPTPASAPVKNSAPPAPGNPGPRNPAPRQSVTARAKTPAEPPLGGLVIYDKGKMIYRMAPSSSGAQSVQQPEAHTNQDAVVLAGQISPDAPDTKQVAEEVAAARLIQRVEPQYPLDAGQHIEGTVVLQAEISREGTVEKLSVLKGNPVLAASALQAVQQWRYRPYTVDGRTVGMRTTITLNFTSPAN